MYKITEKQFNEMPDELQALYNKLPNYSRDEVVSLFPNDNARFFYTAKCSKEERNMNCDDLEEVRHSDRQKDDGVGGDNPRNRTNQPKKNFHPTVKPIDLMEYLVKLVSRENALILDTFTGSGSTLIACKGLKRRYIGIEREADYCEIARKRISKVQVSLF